MGRGLSRVAAVAANTFRETVRERVLYNLVFFALLATVWTPRRQPLDPPGREGHQGPQARRDGPVRHPHRRLHQSRPRGKEIERRSLFPLLAKPLTRDEFYLGKFAGLVFTLLVNLSVMTAGLYLTLLATGRGLDPELMTAVFPILLGLVMVVAFAMLFSTLTSSALASVFTVGVVLAGRFSDVVRNMREVAPSVPTWLIDLLYVGMPNFRNFDFKDRVVYGEAVPAGVLGWVTLYAAAYVGIVLVLGVASFRRRDFQ
jgi:ABC-type transport system involved in multi-copper enzyme maturation permease subunit